MIVRNAPQPSDVRLDKRDYPLSDEAPWVQEESIKSPPVTPQEREDSFVYILGDFSTRIMENLEV